jgi:hypothetical protein
MSSAGLVYMNNPRFGAELNLKVLGMHLLCQYTITICCCFSLNIIDSRLLTVFEQNNCALPCPRAANW